MKRILSAMLAGVIAFTTVCASIPAAAEEPLSNLGDSTETNSASLSVQGANSFGSLAADIYEKQQNQLASNDGYSIFRIVMSDNTAGVQLDIAEDCQLVVAVYDDSGEKMLGSASSIISAEDDAVALTLDVELPQYYLVKAFLLDEVTGKPLCGEFVCNEYTRARQEFNQLSVADFPADRVHNFDNDMTNNFAVYRDDVLVMAHRAGYNKVISVDDENRVYVFGHPDDNFKALQTGDMFSYTYAEIGFIVAKVKDVVYNSIEDTLLISGDVLNLNEAFKVVKIQQTAGTEDLVYYEDGQRIKEALLNEENYPVEDDPILFSADTSTNSEAVQTYTEVRQMMAAPSDPIIDITDPVTLEFCFSFEGKVSTDPEETGTNFSIASTFKGGDWESSAEVDENGNQKYSLPGNREIEIDREKASKYGNFNDMKKKVQEKIDKLNAPDADDNDGKVEVSASATISGTASFSLTRFFIDLSGSDDAGWRFEMHLDYEQEFEIGIDAKLEAEFTLAKLSIPFLLTVGLDVGVEIKLGIEVEIQVHFKETYTGYIAIVYDTNNPTANPIQRRSEASSTPETSFVGSLQIELKIEPLIEVLGGLAKASAFGAGGVNWTGTVSKMNGITISGPESHRCFTCVGIETSIYVYAGLEAGLLYGIIGAGIETDKAEYKTYSHFAIPDENPDSILRGIRCFDGVCQNRGEYTGIVSLATDGANQDGTAIGKSDITVNIYAGANVTNDSFAVDRTNLIDTVTSDEEGYVSIKLDKNIVNYHWYPSTDGYEPDRSYSNTFFNNFSVYTPQPYPINVCYILSDVEIQIQDGTTKQPITSGILIVNGKYDANGQEITEGYGQSYVIENGKTTLHVEPGKKYHLSVVAEGYEMFDGGITMNQPHISMKPMQSPTTVNLVDAETGEPVDLEFSHDKNGYIYFRSNEEMEENPSYSDNQKLDVLSNELKFYLRHGTYTVILNLNGYNYELVPEDGVNVQIDGSDITLRVKPKMITATIIVVDENNGDIVGAEVLCDGESIGVTDEDSFIEGVKLSTGNHIFTVKREGKEDYAEDILVSGSIVKIVIRNKIDDNFVKVFSSGKNMAGITSDGSLYIWGDNEYGQLGCGTTESIFGPVYVNLSEKKVKDVVLSSKNTAVVTEDGSLYIWGDNQSGQLGTGSNVDCLFPYYVNLNNKKVKKVYLNSIQYGGNNKIQTMVLTVDGELYSFGEDSDGTTFGKGEAYSEFVPTKVDIPETVIDYNFGQYNPGVVLFPRITGATSHVALTKSGKLYMWGYGLFSAPTELNICCKSLTKVQMNNGTYSIITNDNNLYMWGTNKYGQVGNGTKTKVKQPTLVLNNVYEASCINNTTAAITYDGKLYVWGNTEYGQAQNDLQHTLSPCEVLLDNETVAELHFVGSLISVETVNGKNWCWGESFSKNSIDSPYNLFSNYNSCTGSMTNSKGIIIFIKDGKIFTMGDNSYGQCGLGNKGPVLEPQLVALDHNVIQAGYSNYGSTIHVRTDDGSIYVWGQNTKGLSADGTTANLLYPTKINLYNNNYVDVIVTDTKGNPLSGAIVSEGSQKLITNERGVARFSLPSNTYTYIAEYNGITSSTEISLPDEIGSAAISLKIVLPYENETSYMNLEISSLSERNEIDLDDEVPVMSSYVFQTLASAPGTHTYTERGLRPNEVYLFISVKNAFADDFFGDDNLLYVNSFATDGSGNISVSYIPDEDYSDPYEFALRIARDSLANADVTIGDKTYTGETIRVMPTVMLNGNKLLYGTDYLIYGEWEAVNAGNYTVSVKGIGEYRGTKSASYNIVKPDVTSISLKTAPSKTSYTKGESIVLDDAVITVTYANGSTEDIDVTTNMISGFDSNTTGTQIITVTYGGKTCTFNITVKSGSSGGTSGSSSGGGSYGGSGGIPNISNNSENKISATLEYRNIGKSAQPGTLEKVTENNQTFFKTIFESHAIGCWANLMKQNDDKLEFISVAQIQKDGSVLLPFGEAEKYVVIVDKYTYLTGDANDDLIVNAMDASAILKHIVGIAPLTENQLSSLDCNGDGTVNAIDASWILKKVVGLIA